MDYGMFSMPLRPPGGDVTKEYHQDVETFVLGDQLGYSEGWMGEHYTIPWEPIPATDLFAATVIARTERIRMGTGIVLLPMHDPRQVVRPRQPPGRKQSHHQRDQDGRRKSQM